MPNAVTLSGWKEFDAKLQGLPRVLTDEINGEVKYAAEKWAELAKKDAPKDLGFLAGGISVGLPLKNVNGELISSQWEVYSKSENSPYMEWGTKTRVNVPADLSAYALQFKGKGQGDYYDFLNAILDWVIRKGIANRYSIKTQKPIKINIEKPGKGKVAKSDYERLQQTAAAIAYSIMKYGVHPHPFFFIQMPIVSKDLFSNVDKILKTEH